MDNRASAGWSLRRWLRRRRFVQLALATSPDPLLFQRPSARIVVGLVLLAASFVLGWPAIAALSAVAAWLGRPKLLLAGPALYGISWLVFSVGVFLIGSKSITAGRAFGLALVRRLAERFLRE